MFRTRKMSDALLAEWLNENGQDLAEYALILVFVVVICVAGVVTLGNTVIQVYLESVLGIFS